MELVIKKIESFKNIDFMNDNKLIISKINTKETVKITGDMLKQIHEVINKKEFVNEKNTKKFLSAYMIINNSEQIFAFKDKNESDLLQISINIITQLNNIFIEKKKEVCEIFVKMFNEYLNIFDKWRKKDASKLVNTLSVAYQELISTKKFLLRSDNASDKKVKDLVQNIDKQIENIKKHTSYVTNEKNENSIKILEKNFKEKAEILNKDEIMEIAKKAFWDTFKEELEENKYDRVGKLLDEVKEKIKAFTPNRKDLKDEINDSIDTELIMQMINNSAFSSEDFFKLTKYLITKIKSLEAPIDDKDTDEWEKELLSLCTDGKKYHEILPFFFKILFTKIEKIQTDIIEFYKIASAVKK